MILLIRNTSTEGTKLNTPGASGALLTGTTLAYGVHDMSRSYKLTLNK